MAWPFTVIAEPGSDADTVWLVAGEDMRFCLRGQGLATWLPGLLQACTGAASVGELCAALPPAHRDDAAAVLLRLYDERVLVNGSAADAHAPAAAERPSDPGWEVLGQGALAEALCAAGGTRAGSGRVAVFAQEALDYHAALDVNRRCLAEKRSWMWVSSGPMARGYVSPLFLPDAGPCLRCIIQRFQFLSPAPELYSALITHAQSGGAIAPVPFAGPGLAMLAQLCAWKIELAGRPLAPAALYCLHVLVCERLEVTGHLCFVDPECPDCAPYRGRA